MNGTIAYLEQKLLETDWKFGFSVSVSWYAGTRAQKADFSELMRPLPDELV